MVCAAVLMPGRWRGCVGAISTLAAPLRLPASASRHLTLTSLMKSKRKMDHLERTASVVRREVCIFGVRRGCLDSPHMAVTGVWVRREVVSPARVCGAAAASPSVRSLRLLVADREFSFKAGQWVDFFIPGVPVVGGFSICSSPRLLEQERVIELAVKYANHAPALWVHNQVLRGKEVYRQARELGRASWILDCFRDLKGRSVVKHLGSRQPVWPLLRISDPDCSLLLSRTDAHLPPFINREGGSTHCTFSSMTAAVPLFPLVESLPAGSFPAVCLWMLSSALSAGQARPVTIFQCALDSEVAVRVGGEFFFDPQPTDASRNLVLIAGGVGINPLLSILRHAADLHRERADKGTGYEIGTVKLFYSAKNTSELLFKKNILNLVNEFPGKIACSLHVTKQTTQISAELKPYITEGRITEEELRDHISRETLFYICGPPPMTDFFSRHLEDSHVPREHIRFEKWW